MITVDTLLLARDCLRDRAAARKNQAASAVECGADLYGGTGKSGFDYAQQLVAELRKLEAAIVDANRELSDRTDGRIGNAKYEHTV